MRNVQGTTLVELIVIIVVLSIIVSIFMPHFFTMVKKAKQAAAKGYLATLRCATRIYYSDNECIWPYQYSNLPFTDANGNICGYIVTTLQKGNNAWVPVYMRRWPPAIRLGREDWGSDSTGKAHEGGNDMKIMEIVPNPPADHSEIQEITYNRSTGELWFNCSLKEQSEYIYNW